MHALNKRSFWFLLVKTFNLTHFILDWIYSHYNADEDDDDNNDDAVILWCDVMQCYEAMIKFGCHQFRCHQFECL